MSTRIGSPFKRGRAGVKATPKGVSPKRHSRPGAENPTPLETLELSMRQAIRLLRQDLQRHKRSTLEYCIEQLNTSLHFAGFEEEPTGTITVPKPKQSQVKPTSSVERGQL